MGEDVSDLTGMPWDLYPSEPPISVVRWTLFDKDPYFGLPGIPEDIPLPPRAVRSPGAFPAQACAGVLRKRGGDPGALRPDSQPRVTEGDPVLRPDGRGQVVGAGRGPLAEARADARRGVSPPRREPGTAGDAAKGARGRWGAVADRGVDGAGGDVGAAAGGGGRSGRGGIYEADRHRPRGERGGRAEVAVDGPGRGAERLRDGASRALWRRGAAAGAGHRRLSQRAAAGGASGLRCGVAEGRGSTPGAPGTAGADRDHPEALAR